MSLKITCFSIRLYIVLFGCINAVTTGTVNLAELFEYFNTVYVSAV